MASQAQAGAGTAVPPTVHVAGAAATATPKSAHSKAQSQSSEVEGETSSEDGDSPRAIRATPAGNSNNSNNNNNNNSGSHGGGGGGTWSALENNGAATTATSSVLRQSLPPLPSSKPLQSLQRPLPAAAQAEAGARPNSAANKLRSRAALDSLMGAEEAGPKPASKPAPSRRDAHVTTPLASAASAKTRASTDSAPKTPPKTKSRPTSGSNNGRAATPELGEAGGAGQVAQMLQQQKQQEALLQQLVQMVQNQQLQMQEMMSLMRKGGVAPEAAAAGSDDKDRRIDALTMEVTCKDEMLFEAQSRMAEASARLAEKEQRLAELEQGVLNHHHHQQQQQQHSGRDAEFDRHVAMGPASSAPTVSQSLPRMPHEVDPVPLMPHEKQPQQSSFPPLSAQPSSVGGLPPLAAARRVSVGRESALPPLGGAASAGFPEPERVEPVNHQLRQVQEQQEKLRRQQEDDQARMQQLEQERHRKQAEEAEKQRRVAEEREAFRQQEKMRAQQHQAEKLRLRKLEEERAQAQEEQTRQALAEQEARREAMEQQQMRALKDEEERLHLQHQQETEREMQREMQTAPRPAQQASESVPHVSSLYEEEMHAFKSQPVPIQQSPEQTKKTASRTRAPSAEESNEQLLKAREVQNQVQPPVRRPKPTAKSLSQPQATGWGDEPPRQSMPFDSGTFAEATPSSSVIMGNPNRPHRRGAKAKPQTQQSGESVPESVRILEGIMNNAKSGELKKRQQEQEAVRAKALAEQRRLNAEEEERKKHRPQQIMALARHLGIDPVFDTDLLFIAEKAFDAPLPTGWSAHHDPQGNEYYYDAKNGTTCWEHPMENHFRTMALQHLAEKERRKAIERNLGKGQMNKIINKVAKGPKVANNRLDESFGSQMTDNTEDTDDDQDLLLETCNTMSTLNETSDSLMDTFSSCGISHSSVGSLSLDLSTSTSGRIDILSKHKGPVRGKGLGLELRSHDSSEGSRKKTTSLGKVLNKIRMKKLDEDDEDDD